jgi:aryl-alcohol dehydrogenase-like predicted oxidoreductase
MSGIGRLGLGTVQFGQAYGISNTSGQVPVSEAGKILQQAAAAGVTLLDTAANYGVAESVLSELDTRPFRIVSKTIGIRNGLQAVIARARQSAETLKADTLLVHAARDLADDALWPALQDLKAQGVFRRIGISVYVADDPVELAARFKPDVMQLPFSLLDQRLLAEGTLGRLNDLGVEVHARSLFLQGLLFLDTLPEKLKHAGPHLETLRRKIADAGSTPLAAALAFVLARPEITFGVVGVTGLRDLDEILHAAKQPPPDLDWTACALNDELVLTPSLW